MLSANPSSVAADHVTILPATSPPPGDYIVYVDESGDHGLESIDSQYPVFVLAFCIFEKAVYATQIVPAMIRFKFEHFGHDQIVLHEHDIKKAKEAFRFLTDATKRTAFMNGLNTLLATVPFTIVAVVIRKTQLIDRYARPENPYMLAMEFGLERVCTFLRECGQTGRLTHFVFERRGAREDRDLELEFRRVSSGANPTCSQVPVEIIMTDKKAVSTGLQIADLVARPIGIHVLRPQQPNRAYDIIERKFRRSGRGQIDGYGLKCFP